jgi:uncharacterized protein YeaO (DUF488 family)
MISLKRAYDPASPADGKRFLVERLWPRGLTKTSLPLDGWLKEVAPSAELRQWFSHDPNKWLEFRKRYFTELQNDPDSWQPLLRAARRGRVTLVYSSRDKEHNAAVALNDFLAAALEKEQPRSGKKYRRRPPIQFLPNGSKRKDVED